MSSHLMTGAGAAAEPFRVFVGYDSREDIAYRVCRRSLLRRSSVPLEVIPIVQQELRAAGLYWRERDPTESTEFSFTRFLTPYLAGYRGWALFVADVAELARLADPRYAVLCVHHDYAPKEATKMDGAVQTVYPRKNWSSMVLFNCGHPKNGAALTPEAVSTRSGAYLHRFMWLDDAEVGEVPFDRVELSRGAQPRRPGRRGRDGAARDTLHVGRAVVRAVQGLRVRRALDPGEQRVRGRREGERRGG